ncbi:unnamed protein product, partial [Meganyctiphanes norvegica]
MAPINKKPIVCHFCPQEFTQVSSRKRHIHHIHINEGKKLFECKYCGTGYSNKANQIRHENEIHCTANENEVQSLQCVISVSTNVKTIFCSFCPQSFVSNSSKLRHERMKHGVKSFHCSYCTVLLPSKISKTYHENDVHGVKIGVTKDILENEFIYHLNTVPDNVYNENDESQNIEENVDPLPLDVNENVVDDVDEDTRNEVHGFVNKNVDTIICSFCPQQFSHLKSKVRHERNKHMDTEKKIECRICSKVFIRKCGKDKHENLFHGVFDFEVKKKGSIRCTDCRVHFNTVKDLRTHRTLKHNENMSSKILKFEHIS